MKFTKDDREVYLTDPVQQEAFKQSGWKSDATPEAEQPPIAPAKPLTRMTKPELEALAMEKGITIPDGATNKDIVALIEAVGGQ